ncbi:MAG TPA: amidohydrolase family protein [Ohtaekwangia sp.]
MRRLTYISSLLFMVMGSIAYAQSPKAKQGTYVLTNATIETITQGVIQNGAVVITNGKIAAVGTTVAVPAGAETIDCKGLWIYPGMIDAATKVGLSEIESDPRTKDFNEVGDVIPQMKALTAINPNSAHIAVTRVSGVTTVLTNPDGDIIPGTAALINLHGYTPDQMFAGFEGIVLNFPKAGRKGVADKRTDDEIKKEYDKKIEKLNDTWEKAVQYHKLDSATKSNGLAYYPEMKALLPVVRGQMALLVRADAAKDILAALKWVGDRKVKRVIFTGVAEGWRVADELVKANIPVIAGPILALPSREYDHYDKAYANPGLMKKAGVKVAIGTYEDRGNVRNLPYHAGFAAAYGMGREEALKAITIVPAEIFGVQDALGSIEVGKNATLFVSDGDPLEPKTTIRYVFINGWNIPLVSRQTELYDEFLNREPGAGGR